VLQAGPVFSRTVCWLLTAKKNARLDSGRKRSSLDMSVKPLRPSLNHGPPH